MKTTLAPGFGPVSKIPSKVPKVVVLFCFPFPNPFWHLFCASLYTHKMYPYGALSLAFPSALFLSLILQNDFFLHLLFLILIYGN